MEKISAILQKYIGAIGIAVFVLLVVYALGMATPAYPLREYMDMYNPDDTTVSEFYTAIMPYNDKIIYFGIPGIVFCVLHGVLRSDKRKIYYVSNFVWDVIYIVFAIASAIVTLSAISYYQNAWNQLDFTTINEYFEMFDMTPMSGKTSVFALGYVVVGILLLSTIPVALVLIGKIIGRVNYEKANKKSAAADTKVSEAK